MADYHSPAVSSAGAMGLISEIVSWKLRLYVPTGAAGADVLARLFERFPIERTEARKAA